MVTSCCMQSLPCVVPWSRAPHLAADVDFIQVHWQGRVAARRCHPVPSLVSYVEVALIYRGTFRHC